MVVSDCQPDSHAPPLSIEQALDVQPVHVFCVMQTLAGIM